MRARSAAASRRHLLPFLTSAAALAFLVGTTPNAEAAWDGTQEICLGDTVSAEFRGDPGEEIHEYTFFAPAGTALKAVLTVGAGDTLVPKFEIWTEGGQQIDLSGALSGNKLKNLVLGQGGRYVLRFTATSGSGVYTFRSKAKYPSTIKQTVSGTSLDFPAVAGSSLNAKIKAAKGSPANPLFDALASPAGAVDIGAPASKLKGVPLASSGQYTLSWQTDTAGDVSVVLKVAGPRVARTWGFGYVDDPRGLADSPRNKWLASGHGDMKSEAFVHWNEDGSVSKSCAKCHSSYGFQDFLGLDGSAFGTVEQNAALGSTVDCNACHNAATEDLSTVTFPSGETVTGLGTEARCMQCHQGRESTTSMDNHIATVAPADDDTPTTALKFRNVHYFAAGATLFGGEAKGGYQYAGKHYDGRFPHVAAYSNCTQCHDVHSLEVRVDECTACHAGVDDESDLHGIRMAASVSDYDGDGNVAEGVAAEIETMTEKLYQAIRDYASGVVGTALVYDSHSHPYFFKDDNANGVHDEGEGSYAPFTARLLRAAYNYQYVQKDPGAFAHNAKYTIELLYDSLENLDAHAAVTVPGFAQMVRNDTGHFDGTAEAYRHWDDDGATQASCSRCHSPGGFDFYATYGMDSTLPTALSDGLECESCHVGGDFAQAVPATRYIAKVTPASGVTLNNNATTPDSSFLCMSCHMGREAKATVDAAIASGKPAFKNVHYLPAGAVMYGADAKVGYQYDGKTYAAKWGHAGGETAQCKMCHLSDHSFQPQMQATCNMCHPEAMGDITKIRRDRATDYDGDGSSTETLADEVHSFETRLYEAIQAYALANRPTAIVYSDSSYPYFFTDTNANGVLDPTEAVSSNSYKNWDAALSKAAFNFQLAHKEPGAWAHNTHYVLQLLYDSIEDLSGNVTGLTRP